jgi:hypothetical protein
MPDDIGEKLRTCEEQQTHIRYLFRALGGYFVDPVSSLDRMLGEKPSLSFADLARTTRETDLGKTASSVKDAESELGKLRNEAAQLMSNSSILSRIKDLPYSLDILGSGTNTLKGVLGTLPAARAEALSDNLKAYAADTDLFICAAKPKEKETYAVVIYSRAREQEVLGICTQSGMAFVDLPANIVGSVSEESAKIAARLTKSKKEEAKTE